LLPDVGVLQHMVLRFLYPFAAFAFDYESNEQLYLSQLIFVHFYHTDLSHSIVHYTGSALGNLILIPKQPSEGTEKGTDGDDYTGFYR